MSIKNKAFQNLLHSAKTIGLHGEPELSARNEEYFECLIFCLCFSKAVSLSSRPGCYQSEFIGKRQTKSLVTGWEESTLPC